MFPRKVMMLLTLTLLFVVTVTLAAFGADPAPGAAAPVAPALADWLMLNKAAIFGVCLAISEFLSLIPGFHGNGILDTVIKALRMLTGKQQAS